MHFPVYIHLGSLTLHPHPVFESLAYFVGFRVYLWTRRKNYLPIEKAMWILVGAIVGAALGSKLVFWFEDPLRTMHSLFSLDLTYLLEGKTITGGLMGGLLGVELMKSRLNVTTRTGDDFAIPLCIGIMIGRIGCFLTGLSDHTYGTPTHLWVGIDFGDGVYRHPTQLYEIVFAFCLLLLLLVIKHRKPWEGYVFQVFMFAYFLFRFSVDFIKPILHPYLFLDNAQVVSLIMLVYYGYLLFVKKAKGEQPRAESSVHVL